MGVEKVEDFRGFSEVFQEVSAKNSNVLSGPEPRQTTFRLNELTVRLVAVVFSSASLWYL